MKIIQIFKNIINWKKDSLQNSLLMVTNIHLYVAFYNFYYYGVFKLNNIYISLLCSIMHSIISDNYVLCRENIIVFGLCLYLHMMYRLEYTYRLTDKFTTKFYRYRYRWQNRWHNRYYL
jgi:hypothetical protein